MDFGKPEEKEIKNFYSNKIDVLTVPDLIISLYLSVFQSCSKVNSLAVKTHLKILKDSFMFSTETHSAHKITSSPFVEKQNEVQLNNTSQNFNVYGELEHTHLKQNQAFSPFKIEFSPEEKTDVILQELNSSIICIKKFKLKTINPQRKE